MSRRGPSPSSAPGGGAASPSRSRRGVKAAAAGISAAVLAVAAVLVVRHRTNSTSLTEGIRQLHPPRTAGPRLSFQPAYRPCALRDSAQLIPSAECADTALRSSGRLRALERRIRVSADSGSYEAVHADALLDLLRGAPRSGLARVIVRLDWLSRLGYHTPDSLADLSAAYLISAGREQSAIDVVMAAEAAARAVEIDPRHPAALFNLAWALETLTFDGVATRAWEDFLRVEPTGGYATEAHAHLQRLAWKPRPAPGADAGDSALASFAGANPQHARELGWTAVLDAWAQALPRGDTATARAALHRAEVLGAALAARRGGDASLIDAVSAIHAHAGDAAATRRLATAHHLYAEGRAAHERSDFATAQTLLAAAARSAGDSPPLAGWIGVFGSAVRQLSASDEAARLARQVLAATDTARYPALAARARWHLAAVSSKTFGATVAEQDYLAASRLFQRAGERENAGMMMIGVAEAQQLHSDVPDRYLTPWLEGATMLRHYQSSSRVRHRPFSDLAAWLASDGRLGLARRASEEDVDASRSSGSPGALTEALALHAQTLAWSGDAKGARAAAASADSILPLLPRAVNEYFSADLRATRAVADPLDHPREVNDALSKAIPEMDKARVPVRLIAAYLARARARTALGWTDSARADVREAYRLIRKGREGTPAGMGRTAENTLLEVVRSLVADGRQREGLELLEFSSAPAEADTAASRPAAVPPGNVAIRYARLGDSLVAWTVTSADVELTRLPTPAREVEATADTALAMMAERWDEAALLPRLEELYARLIGPLERRLGASDTIVVIADGKLVDLPFGALRYPGRNRYLVEDHVVRLAASVGQAAERPPTAARGGVASVGVVLDPTIDATLYPGLPPLEGARGELPFIEQLSRLRGNGFAAPVVFSGEAARRSTVRNLLGSVSLFHFAGHAIADPEDPDSSLLLLARGPGEHDMGRLAAAEIARMDLRGLDLVVLSACATLGGGRSGRAGFSGLGSAFLRAGAHGVIGSLWPVDDSLTNELMKHFYEEYGQNPDAAGALHDAQLKMLAMPNRRFNAPWAWAAFEYAGS